MKTISIVQLLLILLSSLMLAGCDFGGRSAPVETATAVNGWQYKPDYYNPQAIDCYCKPEKAVKQEKLIAPKKANWERM